MNPVAPGLKSLRVLLSGLAAASLAIAVHAQNLPTPVGRVNDFARVLPAGAATELDAAIVAFERTTSLRLVVVTIDSLGGRSVEAYAVDLGKAWRVGDIGRDNGIVFLVAVRDHKFRIQTARAARVRLSDVAADQVRDAVILPHFRRGDLAGGIIEGTRALMQAAAPAPRIVESPEAIAERQRRFAAIVAERQQRAQIELQRRREAERQWQVAAAAAAARRDAMFHTTMLALAGIILAAGLLFAGDWVFLRPIRNRKRVLAGKDTFAAKLREVETLVRHPDVKPELTTRLANLKKASAFLAELRPAITADWNLAGRRFDDAQQALAALESAARMQIDFAAEARRRGPKLLQDLPGVLAATEEKLAKPNVSPEAKQRLEAAKRSFQQAETMQAGMSTTDWVLLYVLLNQSNAGCTEALGVQHQHEIALMTPSPTSSSSGMDFGGGGGGFDSSSGGGFGGADSSSGGGGGGGSTGSW